jgi:hypothetical protein
VVPEILLVLILTFVLIFFFFPRCTVRSEKAARSGKQGGQLVPVHYTQPTVNIDRNTCAKKSRKKKDKRKNKTIGGAEESFVSKVPYGSVSLVFGRTCPGLLSTVCGKVQ